MEYKYVAFLNTQEIIECNNFKVLYQVVRRRIRYDENFEGGKVTGKLYRKIKENDKEKLHLITIL